MSPRKKPDKKVEAQDAPLSSINIANTLVDASGKDDISHYPEVQQNEYTATQAIYPDEFVRIRGRKDAWKNQENLAFRFRVNSFENPAFYVKLDVEFSLDYPKVPLKANIVALEPDSPKLRNELASTIKSIAKTHLNSECVYEVTSAVEDFLNNTARSKAEKVNPFSLEEERARREAAAKLLLKQTEDQSRQQQEDLHATGRRELLSQISSERQQHEGNPLDGTLSNLDPMPLPVFDFERKLTVRVPSTGQTIAFEKVEQRRVELKRDDKIIRLVSPLVEVAAEELPFLVLKEIILDQDLLPPSQMAATMRGIELMLTKASKRHHKHVADIIAYKITYPHQSKEKKYELWILTDWAASGSLHRHLCISPVVFQERVREFTRQILDALAFYESHKFIHPAIHSGNVLLYMPSHENEPTIKLSDGYGTALRSLVDKAREKSSRLPSLPPQWLAPELRDQVGDQVQATALWNLGVIVLQMTLGLAVSTRYASPQECLRKEHFTGDFEDFLCALFQSNPKSRTSADILTAHAFLFKKGPLLKFPSAAVGQPVFQQNSSYSRWKNEWEQASLAGSGGFGTVYKVRKVADQIIYAVKRLKVNKKQPLDPMEYRKEVMNLARLQHPAVVRYYDAWTENFSEEFDQLTDSSSDAPIDEPPASMNVNNEEAMSQMLYDSLMANQGKSIVERLKFKHSFGRPGRGPEQVQSDESDDDESSEGQFDNDDDYDNAFQNGDAHVDNKDLAPAGFSTADRNSSAAITDESNDKPSSNPLNSDKYQQQFARLVRRRPSTVHTGEFYIQMEYCDGQDLKTLIANHLCNDVDSVWRISRGILDGLAYIHQQGVTHRDLKPANIFIGSNGAPKIGDFGLATAIPAREKGGSEVGSPFYMAPEVMSTEPIKNLQKTDMYSLGVIFFEMNTYFGTTTERNGVLTRLGKDPDSITATLGAEGKNAKQIAIIRPLLDHDPDKRPSAAQLLDSGLIPEPMEQEKLDRQLEYIVHNQPERLNTMLTIIENSDVQDLAWDFTAKQEVDSEETTLTAMPSLLLDDTRDRLRRIFSKHGAVESKRQALIPKTRFPAKDAMIVFNSAAMNFQLVQDVTTPFARSVAKQKPRFSKYYSFESSFQLRDESSKSIEPQQTLEANFDYISYKSTDLALKEASTIYLVKEIIAEFPALASGEWFVMINHMDLLDIVLDACNIRPADQFKVKDALASLSYGGMSTKQRRTYWDAVEKLLRKELEIDATAIAFLGKFAYLSAPPDQVRQLLETKLGKTSIGFPRALLLLRRLEETITYLDRLNFGMDIKIAPLFNFRPRLYDGSIAFQCVEKRSGSVLAQGGRYDNLIKYHQRASEDPPVRGVGLRVGLEDLVAITNNLASKKPAAASAVPSRCSVLVTSFDPEQLATSCLDVLQKIWAAGVSAELTEEVESMEALEAMHADDGAFWLVIVRVGLEGSLLIKVRSPSGGEETVGLEEVGEFLRVEVAREKKRA